MIGHLEALGSKLLRVSAESIPEDSVLRQQLDVVGDDGTYPLLVATDMFGMRGVDYRSRKVAMHLIIAKSFDTERGAL